jgi:predicted DNA-binding transcriptional regulator AlpA
MLASDDPPEIVFWRIQTVIDAVGLSKSEIYRQIRRGAFPKPRLYPGMRNKAFWIASEVEHWQLTAIGRSVPKREAVDDFAELLA